MGGQTADSRRGGVVDDVDLVVAELEATLMSEHAIAPRHRGCSVAPDDDHDPDDDRRPTSTERPKTLPATSRPPGARPTPPRPTVPMARRHADAADVPPDPRRADDVPTRDRRRSDGVGGWRSDRRGVVHRADPARDADGPGATVHDLFARIRADVDEVVAGCAPTRRVSAADAPRAARPRLVEVTK